MFKRISIKKYPDMFTAIEGMLECQRSVKKQYILFVEFVTYNEGFGVWKVKILIES